MTPPTKQMYHSTTSQLTTMAQQDETATIKQLLLTLSSAQTNVYSELKLNNLTPMIPIVDGADAGSYAKWKNSVARYENELTKSNLRTLMFRTLSGTALTAFTNLITRADGTLKELSWKEITEQLDKHCIQSHDRQLLKQKIQEIRQHPNETPSNYSARYRQLIVTAFTPHELANSYRQQDLIESFISGLQSTELRLKLVEGNHTTLDSAMKHANEAFSAMQIAKTMEDKVQFEDFARHNARGNDRNQISTLQNDITKLKEQISLLQKPAKESIAYYDYEPDRLYERRSRRDFFCHPTDHRNPYINDYRAPCRYRYQSPPRHDNREQYYHSEEFYHYPRNEFSRNRSERHYDDHDQRRQYDML